MWFILLIGSCGFVTAQQQGPFAVQSNGVSIAFQNSGGIATSSGGVSIAFQNSGGIAASSGGVSIAFQNSGGIAAGSNGVSISFQNDSNLLYLGGQGVTIGFDKFARQLQVTPLNPLQRNPVQAVGTNFTPGGNVILYLTDPNNVTREVGSGVADSLGQATVNYTTLCTDVTGYNAFRMADVASGTYSNSYTINIAPDVTGCSVISGTITYGNAIGNPAPPRFVKSVSVASTVGSPSVGPVVTGTPGTYALTGFGSGSYTIKPTKPGGASGAITSNDAARVAQGVSGSLPFVSSNQRFAADTTGNGSVSSQDAAKLAQFVAGLPSSPPNFTGQWRFFVSNLPAFPAGAHPQERNYASIVSNAASEDYIGILIGEVSGNWNPATHARPVGSRQLAEGSRPERGIVVELTAISTSGEKEIVVPVNVQGIADKRVISYEFDLRYDPSVIQPLVDTADMKGTVSRGLSVVTNATEPGLLRVVVYGAMPVIEDGVLLMLRFGAVGSSGSVSPLTLERIVFNEGDSAVGVTDGRIELY